MNQSFFFLAAIALATFSAPAVEVDLKPALAVVKQVGPEGRGNAEAASAWQTLSKADAKSIPALLAAMDDANDLAANWLRAAVDAIADRELKADGKLPAAALREFLADTRHHPRARRLAFELIARIEPSAAEKLVPMFADDPSVELRRDAVQRLLDAADKALTATDKNSASKGFRAALNSARDEAQIKKAAAELRKLGEDVDLPRHFGFLMEWKIIGPFDNAKLIGFDAAYPPEKAVNLAAEHEGKTGKVRWSDLATKDDYGMVDFNKPFGDHKGVTAYAYAEFNAATARPAELRLGCKNGWKVWFNGKLLFGRDEYHRGSRLDQYRLPIDLKAGTNTILVKACQNEEVKDWTKEWQFQLRVCDATGTAILAKDRAPTAPKTAAKTTAQK
ncbi:MAG: hypothetical protein EXS29_01000 [Pedosphaera sp.]|nr:hypothetical protein [Pedosphaera sp.]